MTRTRNYEAQSIILEAEVTKQPQEVKIKSGLTELTCTIITTNHRDFSYLLDKPTIINWHISGLPDFQEGDYLRIYTTPKKIENSTITYPRRIDRLNKQGLMISRHFC